MFFITDFADAAVILPVAVTVAVLLALLGWRRGAVGWSVGVLAALAAVLIGKLALFACPGGQAMLRSPSGHTASAAVVYGGVLALPASRLLVHARRRWAWSSLMLAAVFGGLAALVIGASRLLLGVHSLDDVLSGAACGVLGLWLMLGMAGPMPPRLVRRQPLTAVLGTMLIGAFVVLLHGERLPIEPMLHLVGLKAAYAGAVRRLSLESRGYSLWWGQGATPLAVTFTAGSAPDQVSSSPRAAAS